jgi:hypothetical protein
MQKYVNRLVFMVILVYNIGKRNTDIINAMLSLYIFGKICIFGRLPASSAYFYIISVMTTICPSVTNVCPSFLTGL